MKAIALAAAIAATTTAASAAELGIFGLTAGGEAIAEYNYDAESFMVTLEPEIGYTIQPVEVELTVSTLLTAYNDEFVLGDTKPTIDFEARKGIVGGLEIYGGVGYDLEAEDRTDIKFGASFEF